MTETHNSPSRAHPLRIAVGLLLALGVGALALGLRLRAVSLLPIDYDEDDYLLAAQHYAEAIRLGDWQEVTSYDYNYEHPPLTKLVYGLSILNLPVSEPIPDVPSSAPPARSLPQPHFRHARQTAAWIGAIQALALAALNPLAGLLLGIHTWQIKYTSQIMLEPLPALFSTLAVLLYAWSRATSSRWRSPAIVLSAIAFGLSVASKYVYGLAGLAILADWTWEIFRKSQADPPLRLRRSALPIVVWGLLALLTFFAADPFLWPDPIHRLVTSLTFHSGYAQSAHVKEAGFPVWQPLVWLSEPVPWHPGTFVVALDLLISVLALLGIARLWRSQRVFALWLLMAMGFLLVWPTKWPQYILVLTAPLCLAGSYGLQAQVWPRVGSLWRALGSLQLPALRQKIAQPPSNTRRAIPWLLPGAVALLLLAVFPLAYQMAMALTDFNGASLRDGLAGGVWREVWLGLTGRVAPTPLLPFGTLRPDASRVHFSGPGLLLQLLGGQAGEVLFFNVMWTGLSVAGQAILGLAAALLLARRGVRRPGLWRAVFILPWAIPEFIGALVWLRTFEPKIGWLAKALPADVPLPATFSDPEYALGVLLVAGAWYGFPFIMLAATAGLRMVPQEVYDAAAIDGAGSWSAFRYVTWPLLLPLVVPALIIRSIFAFNQFYLFYTMQPPYPMTTLATASFYYFGAAREYAVSAAINIFTVLILVALVLWFNRWSRAAEGVTYA